MIKKLSGQTSTQLFKSGDKYLLYEHLLHNDLL